MYSRNCIAYGIFFENIKKDILPTCIIHGILLFFFEKSKKDILSNCIIYGILSILKNIRNYIGKYIAEIT